MLFCVQSFALADIWSAFQSLLFSKDLKPKLTTINQFGGLHFFTGDFYKIDKILSSLKELHFTRKPHTIKYIYFQVFISCLYMHSCVDM